MAHARARELRKGLTDVERRMWHALRPLKHHGLHFRKQVPFGYYVVDFACHGAKLIVELDGSQHGDDANVVFDAERTAFLESRGYRALRFWNREVLTNTDGLVELIFAEAKARLPPHP